MQIEAHDDMEPKIDYYPSWTSFQSRQRVVSQVGDFIQNCATYAGELAQT